MNGDSIWMSLIVDKYTMSSNVDKHQVLTFVDS